MFTALRTLMYAADEPTFLKKAEGFCAKYVYRSQSFVEYFSSNYLNRSAMWALCYRKFPHGKSNINTLVETFHKTLNTLYLGRKTNRRVDDLINFLFEIEKIDYMRRKRSLVYDKLDLGVNYTVKSRHDRGHKIPDAHIKNITDNVLDEFENCLSWKVTSLTKAGIFYTVNVISESCTSDYCAENCCEPACSNL